jgi:hypothetical protein
MKFILSHVNLASLLTLALAAHAADADGFSLRGADRRNHPTLTDWHDPNCFNKCMDNLSWWDNDTKDVGCEVACREPDEEPLGKTVKEFHAAGADGFSLPLTDWHDPNCFNKCMDNLSWWDNDTKDVGCEVACREPDEEPLGKTVKESHAAGADGFSLRGADRRNYPTLADWRDPKCYDKCMQGYWGWDNDNYDHWCEVECREPDKVPVVMTIKES